MQWVAGTRPRCAGKYEQDRTLFAVDSLVQRKALSNRVMQPNAEAGEPGRDYIRSVYLRQVN